MGPRNLMILFFSTLAVSLVILIIFFSLFFKNVDLSFDTKMPESAPDLGNYYKGAPSQTKGDSVGGASIRVPQDEQPRVPSTASSATTPKESSGVGDENLDTAPPPTDIPSNHPTPDEQANPDNRIDHNNATPPVPGAGEAPKPQKSKATKPAAKPMRIDPDGSDQGPPGGPGPTGDSRHSAPAPSTPTPGDAGQTGAAPKHTYQVYIDGFNSKTAAEAKSEQLKASGQAAYVKAVGNQYVLQLGVFGTKEHAQSTANTVGAKVRPL